MQFVEQKRIMSTIATLAQNTMKSSYPDASVPTFPEASISTFPDASTSNFPHVIYPSSRK